MWTSTGPPTPPGFQAELRQAHGWSEHTRAVLFLGRKLEYKGIATLVEAFKRLPRDLDAVLLLAGPSSPWFDEFYRRLPAEDRARIIDLGAVSHPDKVHLLHLADVLVLPSRFEAFGIVILEAWACGTPVIVASSGAMPSIVGQGGLAFEYGNAAELAAQIQRLLDDAELAGGMARRGHQRLLERYTWEKVAAAVRTAYLPLGAKPRPRRVLICSNLFPPHTTGGGEIVAHTEALLLKELGVDVEVFCGRVDRSADGSYRAAATNGGLKRTSVTLSQADISGESVELPQRRDPAAVRRRPGSLRPGRGALSQPRRLVRHAGRRVRGTRHPDRDDAPRLLGNLLQEHAW